MKNSNHFYVIVGASATGKGSLINQLVKEKKWVRAKKYSTRDYRGADDDIVLFEDEELKQIEQELADLNLKKEKSVEQLDSLQWDLDKIKAKKVEKRLSLINEKCGGDNGQLYFLNGNFYGIETSSIPQILETNNAVVVCSDFAVIRRLKSNKSFGHLVRVVYIASTIDEKELLKRYKERESISFKGITNEKIKTIEELSERLSSAGRLRYYSLMESIIPKLADEWNEVLPYYQTIKKRAASIRMLYNRYIDHIHEIDYTILNFYDLDYMYDQMRNYINHDRVFKKTKAPVFMVCAAPSSGKATLMNIAHGLGRASGKISVTTKYATRSERPTDKRDGMIAIGEDGKFDAYISNKNDVWSWSFHNGQTQYAVDLSKIKDNTNHGIAQIFISNFTQAEKAHVFFPRDIVILYLHSTHKTQTEKHIMDKCVSDVVSKLSREKNISREEAFAVVKNDDKYKNKVLAKVSENVKTITEVHEDFRKLNYKVDHVLLNTGTDNDLIEQLVNLINFYMN